ncbi:MAG: succinate dehydrogenase assembly factor 2 [Pseudomonadota bacterium]|nr:succinate dehydrogenase assembly factor 2 [Pseudomonadota bacterium]
MSERVKNNKLYWRLRRGVLELDFVFQKFWQTGYAKLDSPQKQAFAKLLECQDPDLLSYLVYRTSKPKEDDLSEIVTLILDFIDEQG